MNKNTGIILGILGVAVVGLGLYMMSQPTDTTPTPTTNEPATVTTSTTITTVTTTAAAPTAQTGANATVYTTAVALTGTVNPNGATTAYWYEYGITTGLGTRSASQGAGSGFSTVSAPAFITGLQPSTTYYYRLSAQNAHGTVSGTTYSFTTNTVPPPQGSAPTAQTNAATDIAQTTVKLHGQADPNGAETTTWFELGTTTDLGFVTPTQSIGSGSNLVSVSVSIANLVPATTYYFRMNAQNAYGTVNGQVLSFTTTGPASPAEPIVETSAATAVTGTSARLNGQINPNGAATTYWFEYSEDSFLGSILGSTTQEQIASGNAVVSVFANITDLDRDTAYYFQLVGRNQFGTERGDIMSFTTQR